MNIGQVRTQYEALVTMGEATVALAKARDLIQLAHGGAQAAASVDVLYQAANSLTLEMGTMLTALRDADDDEVRAFVRLLLHRLHGPRAVTPAAQPSEESTS